MKFRLHPKLDAPRLIDAFAEMRRVRIRPFFDESVARELHAHLRGWQDWRQVVNSGDKVFELDRATREQMTPDQRTALDEAVWNGAREGFQYRYESIRLPDGDALLSSPDPLAGFTRWMSDGPVRDLLRAVTGSDDIAFADGQATAYAPGDFLTGHDDLVPGKNRRAAYVLGLTPAWRIEWGGLLLFHGADGALHGQAPGFNSCDIFSVPQLHSVSAVTRSALFRRYSITGWLRGARGEDGSPVS